MHRGLSFYRFNQLGYDVMEMAMPMHGCNRILEPATSCERLCVDDPARGFNCSGCRNMLASDSHDWFEQFEEAGDEAMRYFLEPVRQSATLSFSQIV
jgi:hypothetical protein